MGLAESQTPGNTVAGDHAGSGPAHTGQPNSIMQTLPHKHCYIAPGDNSGLPRSVQTGVAEDFVQTNEMAPFML